MKKRFKTEKKEKVIPVDLVRVVKYDEDGNELVSFEPVDYAEYIASLGSANDWSLKSLMAAGINPDFPIKTGISTRLDGLSQVDGAVAYLDEILASGNNNEENEE